MCARHGGKLIGGPKSVKLFLIKNNIIRLVRKVVHHGMGTAGEGWKDVRLACVDMVTPM